MAHAAWIRSSIAAIGQTIEPPVETPKTPSRLGSTPSIRSRQVSARRAIRVQRYQEESRTEGSVAIALAPASLWLPWVGLPQSVNLSRPGQAPPQLNVRAAYPRSFQNRSHWG